MSLSAANLAYAAGAIGSAAAVAKAVHARTAVLYALPASSDALSAGIPNGLEKFSDVAKTRGARVF
jgi:hypothetical protein